MALGPCNHAGQIYGWPCEDCHQRDSYPEFFLLYNEIDLLTPGTPACRVLLYLDPSAQPATLYPRDVDFYFNFLSFFCHV